MARRRLQVLALLADVRAYAERNAVQGETAMPFYEKGDVRVHYEEAGAGFPLLLIPGGGLNSNIGFWSSGAPFNAMEAFKDEYRCIAMDLRNAHSGQSSGPVQVEKPWDAYADDQLGLMDHLGI
jgi:pimeloyl-ACP methyl ester carboxylesterase